MPVEFLCDHCRKHLKVGRRKIGSDVTCPKCGQPTLVPDEETAAVSVAMHRLTQSVPQEIEIPEFRVFDEPELIQARSVSEAAEAGPSSSIVSSRRGGSPAVVEAPRPAASPTRAPAYPRPMPRSGAPEAKLLVSRNTLYLQAVLFSVVAVVAFGAGYLVGRGNSPVAAGPAGAEDPVVLEGTLTYSSAEGLLKHDGGAVVIAIPQGKYPKPLWKVTGLGPLDPEPASGSQTVLTLEELGARYTRADADGHFLLSVPRPGTYHLLLVAQNARRPFMTPADAADLDELRRYFLPAPDLIGRQKYQWTKVELRSGLERHSHNLGVDGR